MKNNFGYVNKLYIWSILMDPLLYFVFISKNLSQVNITASRVLQLLLLTILLFRFVVLTKDRLLRLPPKVLYERYIIYFLWTILSGFFGLVIGSYTLQVEYGPNFILSSELVRPFLEYLIYLFYFIYFCVFPFYLIYTHKGIEYFFSVFRLTFFVTFFLGWIDFLSIYFFNYPLLTRHLNSDVFVGLRFHGLAGEPRDAFNYLIFSLSMFYLYKLWNKAYKLPMLLVISILCAIVLTKSGSGVVGLGISVGLVFLYTFRLKNIIPMMLISVMIAYLIYLSVIWTPRLNLFYVNLDVLYNCLNSECRFVKDSLWSGQLVNIIPIWERWIEIKELNIFPTIFGTGNGSASVVNNIYMGAGRVSNPHSNVIRLFYDNGLMGLILFIIAFIVPIKKAMQRSISPKLKESKMYILSFIFVLGGFLGHRSSSLFILFGISMAVFLLKSDIRNTSFIKNKDN